MTKVLDGLKAVRYTDDGQPASASPEPSTAQRGSHGRVHSRGRGRGSRARGGTRVRDGRSQGRGQGRGRGTRRGRGRGRGRGGAVHVAEQDGSSSSEGPIIESEDDDSLFGSPKASEELATLDNTRPGEDLHSDTGDLDSNKSATSSISHVQLLFSDDDIPLLSNSTAELVRPPLCRPTLECGKDKFASDEVDVLQCVLCKAEWHLSCVRTTLPDNFSYEEEWDSAFDWWCCNACLLSEDSPWDALL